MPNFVTNMCLICTAKFNVLFKKRSQKTCSKACSYKLRIDTRHSTHDPIEKICKDCNNLFQDTSKKKLVEKCGDCINKKMVATRQARGSYERTAEQNEKLSRTLKKKYESGWNPNTDELKSKMSINMKAAWASGSFREKSRRACLKKYGTDHWMQSEKAYKMLVKRIQTSWAKQGYREDLDCYFRSSWEANFARICNFEGKSWEYEPEIFDLGSDIRYTPDFRVGDAYFEIKGYNYPKGKDKIELFKAQYPNIQFELIDSTKYFELKRKYENLIKDWEK